MSSLVYLLDTSILLHMSRGDAFGKYVRGAFDLDNLIYRPLVSIVTHGEIWVLADRNKWGENKRAECRRILGHVLTEDLGQDEILNAYVTVNRVAAQHPGGKYNLGDNDLWIAATAAATGAVLLTTDKDFRIFHPDHVTVTWIDPADFGAGS